MTSSATTCRFFAEPRQALMVPGISKPSLTAANTEQTEMIVAKARGILNMKPPTVVDKKEIPPSGDKQDYLAMSIYWWENPNTPDGMPFLFHDGKPNPKLEEYDHTALSKLAQGVDILTMAWMLTQDQQFSDAAARWLRAWFLDKETGMKPNMNWAQFIPGHGPFETPGGYPIRYIEDPVTKRGLHCSFGGTIEACNLITLPESAEILEASGSWSRDDAKQLRAWFGHFLNWLHTSIPGNDARQCRNNHASWFCGYAGYSAVYSENRERGREIFGSFCRTRLESQIHPDGTQPEELHRANSFGYVGFTLMAFCNTAILAERIGVDLWNHPTPQTSRLRTGIDWLLPYLLDGKKWEYRADKPITFYGVAPVMAAAYYAWKDEKYRRACQAALTLDKDNTGESRKLFQLLYSV